MNVKIASDRTGSFLIIFALFVAGKYHGQENTEHVTGSFRAHAGLIVNRAYSNIHEKVEVIDESSRIERTPSDSAGNAKTGFILGFELLPGRSEKLRGCFALSFARSAAVYHSSYTEEAPTSRPGFTHMSRATELDFVESYFYMDLHAGLRGRVVKGLYLTGGLVFDRPLVSHRQNEGYVLTTYSASGSPDTESTISYLKQDRQKVKGDSNFSFRLRAEYEFPLGESTGAVYLFRNFGFVYTLPWWSVGFSYSLD